MNRVLLALFLVAVGISPAQAAPFQNGGFELGTLSADPCNTPLSTGDTSITGWTVVNQNIDYLPANCWTPSEGNRSLDLIGGAVTSGGVQQTFDTIPGRSYQVVFDLAGNPGGGIFPSVKNLTVTADAVPRNYTFYTGNELVPPLYTGANMGWTPHSFQYTPAGATSTLRFASSAPPPGFAGAALDNVRVSLIPLFGWTATGGTVYSGQQSSVLPQGQMICSGAGSNWTQSGGGPFAYPGFLTSFGPQEKVVGSYAVPAGNTAEGICGSWTFGTEAIATGTLTLQWNYTGDHGTSQVRAVIEPFVSRGGIVVQQAVIALAITPAVAFDFTSQYAFNLQAGDIYGFRLTGANHDSLEKLSGTLTLSGTGASSMTLTSPTNPAPAGSLVTLDTVVSGAAAPPTGTVSFTDGALPIAGCTAMPLVVVGATTSSASCNVTLSAGVHTIAVTYSGSMTHLPAANQLLQTMGSAAPLLSTPVLIRSLPTGSSAQPRLIGRLDGAPGTPITVRLFSGTTCLNGVLGGTVTRIGSTDDAPTTPPVVGSTDLGGYFGTDQGGVQGQFVAIGITSPQFTPLSNCLVTAADNDTWPKALRLFGDNATVPDWIDTPGKTRWYRFSVLPNQTIQVSMTGPASKDYDLAVFKDINQEWVREFNPTTTFELTRLSAQFAPTAFSPTAFSPTAFSPTAFSPTAFSPTAFSPTAFSPSAFSATAFSPTAFSPTAFSPTAFSPTAFSPTAFSPTAFSPTAFSPTAFSPTAFSYVELVQAFSAAQTRSIIATSMTPGTSNESVVVKTWNNTGDFYVRVTGRGGAFSTTPYTLTVDKQGHSCAGVTSTWNYTYDDVENSYNTIVLLDSTKSSLADLLPPNDVTLADALVKFVARPEVNGVIIDVATYDRVAELKTQADNNPACPFAKNLVAQDIRNLVNSYAVPNPALKYVVIIGNDDAIPFFRHPDQTLIGQESAYVPPVDSNSPSEASLRNNYMLTQDFYGATTSLALRSSSFPIPGLAVGRLVETPEDIVRMLDAYTTANGTMSPHSSLVTGYDFLQDAADAIAVELALGTNQPADTLITSNTISPADTRTFASGGPWTATNLRDKLVNARHDVIFLAGHFNANSALAADFKTNLITTDLALADLANTLVFSAGCHSGYNIVDTEVIGGVTYPLDWAQAFARKGATLVAGTGYQYGDTEFLEYSERLYVNFAKELRAGTAGTSIAIGEALVKAKRAYLASTQDVRGLHEKAVLEATLFGLPMLGVNMPGARTGHPVTGGVVDALPPAAPTLASAALGLRVASLGISPTLTPHTLQLKNFDTTPPGTQTAFWLSGSNGVVTNPLEPALPLQIVNVTPLNPGHVLRGVGFVGGSYSDSTVFPLTGAPATELRGVHTPFSSPLFFPMRLWTSNYYDALAGGNATKLLVTPAQHRALDAMNSTLRQYSSLAVRLFYSDLGAITDTANIGAFLSAAPTIVSVETSLNGANTVFSAQVVGDPAAAIHQVWVTYTSGGGGTGTWTSLDLQQCVVPLPAACGATADSQVWKAQVATSSLPADARYVVQAASGTGLVSLDDNLGRYHSIGPVASAAPTALVFTMPVPTTAVFATSPSITAVLTSAGSPLAGKSVTISAGAAARVGITDNSGSVTVQLPMLSTPGSYALRASFGGDQGFQPSANSGTQTVTISKAATTLAASGVGAVLTAGAQPLMQESVKFLVSGPHGLQHVFAITDYTGRAGIPPPGLAAGTYSIVQACYAGDATYLAASLNVSPPCDNLIGTQTIDFPQPPSQLYVPSGTFTVSATATSMLPVTFTTQTPGVCTISAQTVTMVTSGLCTIRASQDGDSQYQLATPVDRTITIHPVSLSNPQVSLQSSANPSVTGQTVSFTATVAGNAPVPAGSITFRDGNIAICTAVPMSQGQATCTTYLLAQGSHAIVASYSGDSTYASGDSSSLTQTVGAVVHKLTVTRRGSGQGTVSSASVHGISCGTDCNESYATPTMVQLTAIPGLNSAFAGWLGGGCTGTNPQCTVNVSNVVNVWATFAPSAYVPFRLDIDGNQSADALSDGLLIFRYLSGLTGHDLIAAIVGNNPANTTALQIVTYLDNVRPLFDIDGNGQADAATDGMLLLRYLFGLRDNKLIAGVVAADATRTGAVEIEAYIKALLP